MATGWEVGRMMTEAQKKMIAKMRGLGAGYTEVAKQLDLPVGTIKTYCRRNGLTGDRRDTQHQKKPRNTRENDLIDVENRGNSTATDQPESLENTKVLPPRPTCEIMVSFADDPDETAVADVIHMLRTADYSKVVSDDDEPGAETEN
jgi:hypothetical protein